MTYITHISNMHFYRDGDRIKCMYRHTQEIMAVATLDKPSRRITVQMSPSVANSQTVKTNSRNPQIWNETIIQVPATGKKKKDLKTWNSFIANDIYMHIATAVCDHYGNRKCHGTQAHAIGKFLLIGKHDDSVDLVSYRVHLINGVRHSDIFDDGMYSVGDSLGIISIDVADCDITLHIRRPSDSPLHGYRYGFFAMGLGRNPYHSTTQRLAISPENGLDINYFYSKEILVPYVEKFALMLKEMQRDNDTPVDSTATDVMSGQNNITHVN